MKAQNFVPKVKQLEQIKIELEENDEKEIKVNSKKKKIDNGKMPMKLGFDDEEEKIDKDGLVKNFVPLFANKNKKNSSPKNSINKMFQKANEKLQTGEMKRAQPKEVRKKKSMMELSDVDEEPTGSKKIKKLNESV